MSFIGIDLGGTFLKGAILDVDTRQIRHSLRVPCPNFESGETYERVIAPEKILAAFRSLLDGLLSIETECDGLLLCGQMHALVFCDSQGNHKSSVITWQDQRAKLPFQKTGMNYIDFLVDSLRDWDLRILGNELRAGLPLTQLFYLISNGLLPDNLYPASLMDFVAANLCGTVPVTDSTNADAHGLYNVVEGNWDYGLIEKFGFNKLLWQELKPHYSTVGTFKHNGRSIPCYLAFGDQQCALLGSFLGEDELSLNIGTGSQVGILSNTCELGDFQTRPYFDGKFLKTITHLPAGRALNSLIRLFTEISAYQMDSVTIWNYVQRQVEKTQETDLDVAISFYGGPFGDKGHISNMRESSMTVGHVFSAAFKNMAENYYQCSLRLSPEKEWRRIVFSGGLVSKIPSLQKAILRRYETDSFRINQSNEEVLMGLLTIAVKIHNVGMSLNDAIILTQTANVDSK